MSNNPTEAEKQKNLKPGQIADAWVVGQSIAALIVLPLLLMLAFCSQN